MTEDSDRIIRESHIDTFSNSVEAMTYAAHVPTGIRTEHPVRLIAERDLVRLVLEREKQ